MLVNVISTKSHVLANKAPETGQFSVVSGMRGSKGGGGGGGCLPNIDVIQTSRCGYLLATRKGVVRGVQLWQLFLFDERRDDPNTT